LANNKLVDEPDRLIRAPARCSPVIIPVPFLIARDNKQVEIKNRSEVRTG
jgi:hypothetical protein